MARLAPACSDGMLWSMEYKHKFQECMCYLAWSQAILRASQLAQWVKNLPAMQEMQENVGSMPGLGRSPGGGHGNPLQYSCLENPMDRGAWQAAVHRVAQSWTRQKLLSTHAQAILQAVGHSISLGPSVRVT